MRMLLEQLQHCYLYPHLKSQNPKISSNRLFSRFFKSLYCYSKYSFLNSHCSSFNQYFNLFWPVYIKFFFLSFLSFSWNFSLSSPFSPFSSPFSPSVLRSSRHCLGVGIFSLSRGWVDGGGWDFFHFHLEKIMSVGVGLGWQWVWRGSSSHGSPVEPWVFIPWVTGGAVGLGFGLGSSSRGSLVCRGFEVGLRFVCCGSWESTAKKKKKIKMRREKREMRREKKKVKIK